MAIATVSPSVSPYTFKVQTDEYRTLPIPGTKAKVGDCFIRVDDLPKELETFMKVNPRVPTRSKKGILSGPVIKGILETLRDNPNDMSIKNQGIYILAKKASFEKEPGGGGVLTISLDDPNLHGIVNGGHTFAAIHHAIEEAEDYEKSALHRAYVRLHILQGIEQEKVPEIAEGLNRSKQVDDPSLDNLRGYFEDIKKVLEGIPGADQISYSQGADGDMYITEVLVFLEMFNCQRFPLKKHPHYFFSRTKSALQFFERDVESEPSPIALILPRLPEILKLADTIRLNTPKAAQGLGFDFGRMKERKGAKTRAKIKGKKELLPFIGETTEYRVPRGWLYPMLSAFRANVSWDLAEKKFDWYMPLDQLSNDVIIDLVDVCLTEHRDNNLKPDFVGKRESTYRQCYDKILLHLLRAGIDIS